MPTDPTCDAAATPRKLCLCVDDVGMNPGVAGAALELIEMGRVHAIGCITGGPVWTESAARLRPLDPHRTDVGLHLDLTEFPLLVAPRRLASLIALSYFRRLHRRGLRLEIRAQLDRFEQAMGRAPAFVDGHQHVHQLPIVRDELAGELLRRYPGRLPWLRSTRSAALAGDGVEHGWRHRLKPRIIEALGASALAAQARRAGLRQNRRLLGVYDFSGGAGRYRGLLHGWLRAAATADLLMCHPGLTRDPSDALAHSRRDEYEVLAGADFGELLGQAGVALEPMSRILGPDSSPGALLPATKAALASKNA